MVLLSHFPIDADAARTFQHFLWKDMPGALLPTDPVTQQPWYSQEDLQVFRLSSKSHWDVPIHIPVSTMPLKAAAGVPKDGQQQGRGSKQTIRTARDIQQTDTGSTAEGVAWAAGINEQGHGSSPELLDDPSLVQVASKRVHMLLHHPTPPAFDGAERRNVRRNHDEIRLWADYIGCGVCGAASTTDADYIYDDHGHTGGIAAGRHIQSLFGLHRLLLQACC